MLLWGAYPTVHFSIKYSVMWFLCVSCLGVFAILGAGWGSNSKYSFFGSVRGVAQSISYEACLTIIVLHYIVFFFFGFLLVLEPLVHFLFVVVIIFFICSLAETNRSPFDFSEGESELVSGFNTEYRSVPFVMIFLAEYMSILFIATLISVLFVRFSGVFVVASFWGFIFVWCRATLPRLRYDQLMSMAWKGFLPSMLRFLSVVLVLYVNSNKLHPVFNGEALEKTYPN